MGYLAALFSPVEDCDPEAKVCEYSMSNHFNTSQEEEEDDDDDDVSFPVVEVVTAFLRPKIALPPLLKPLARCCSSLNALATMSLTNTYTYKCQAEAIPRRRRRVSR